MEEDNVRYRDIKAVCVLEALDLLTDKKRKRRFWVHPLNTKRVTLGQFHRMYFSIRDSPEQFSKYYQMSVDSFDELLNLIRPEIVKRNTSLRDAISIEERLTVTIRYLATGVNFGVLKDDFLMGRSTIATIIKETCKVIWNVLHNIVLEPPNETVWQEKTLKFQNYAHFPNCMGAFAGKQIRLNDPQSGGLSYMHRRKKYSTIVLIAAVDTDYLFTLIDVDGYGKESDGNLFKQSVLGNKLFNKELSIPDKTAMIYIDTPNLPYVFVADEAFTLHKNMLRPFPKRTRNKAERIFNYRLNVARRYADCAFALLSNKWRILQTNILVSLEFTIDITKAACVLHNFITERDGYNFEDSLECQLENLPVRGSGCPTQGKIVRKQYVDYFSSEKGAVPWQDKKI